MVACGRTQHTRSVTVTAAPWQKASLASLSSRTIFKLAQLARKGDHKIATDIMGAMKAYRPYTSSAGTTSNHSPDQE